MADTDPKEDETYSEAETEARMAAALKRALSTPPKPHKTDRASERKDKKTNG